MAQAPRIQPFDVGGHYSQIGKAAGELVTEPVSGYFRGQEIGAKAKQAELESQKKQFELDTYARDLEQAETDKKALERVKETSVRLLLGDEGYFALDPKKKERMTEGEWSVETGGVLKEDIPYDQALLIVRDINNAKSGKEIKAILGAVGRFVETQREMRKYKGIKLDSFKADQVQPKTDKEGNVTVAYAEDYPKRAREIAKPTFLQAEAKKALQEYIKEHPEKTAKETADVQAATKHVLASKYGADIAADKNLRDMIDKMFSDEWAAYRAKSERLRAEREGRKETKDIALQNQKVLGLIDDKIASAEKNIENKIGGEYKALISTGKYLDPDATKNFTDAQREILRKKGDEIMRYRKIREIPNVATQNGEFISLPQAEAIYDDALDGTFSSPLTKKYAPAIGMQESAQEGAHIEEPAPAAAPTPAPAAPTPAPAAPTPKPEGLTPQQEDLVNQYMQQYPGYSKEQIIEAMKSKGYL